MAGETDCILHVGTTNAHGYGVLSKPVNGSRLAHRAALAEALGRPVVGVAMHTCDTPPCVNPEHLREGTQADNMADAKAKGRMRGGRHSQTHCSHGHELTKDNVRLKPNMECRSGYERVCITCSKVANQKVAAKRKADRASVRAARQAQESIYG